MAAKGWAKMANTTGAGRATTRGNPPVQNPGALIGRGANRTNASAGQKQGAGLSARLLARNQPIAMPGPAIAVTGKAAQNAAKAHKRALNG